MSFFVLNFYNFTFIFNFQMFLNCIKSYFFKNFYCILIILNFFS